MENNRIKLRINLDTREFEVEGDAKYINETFGSYIYDYLEGIKDSQKSKSTADDVSKKAQVKTKEESIRDTLPDSFGEYLNRFPRTLKDVDRLLIASYYVQMKNSTNYYTVPEASNFLIDQGIKLSNASAFNTANEATKRIFKLSGKNFRVSDSGIQYIKTLFNKYESFKN